MLELIVYACLAVPWIVVVYVMAADEVSFRRSVRRHDGRADAESSWWTAPSASCPRCGGNTWYDPGRDGLRCDTCEWPDPEPEP